MAVAAAPLPPSRIATVAVRRVVVLVVAAIVLAAVHVRWRPATVCLLRGLTGVPCPFCGGTTAMVDLGRGDPGAAIQASPLGLIMLATWPFLGSLSGPSWWRDRRWRWSLIAVLLLASEFYELTRFHLL